KVFVQAVANVVAVERVGKPAALNERVLQGERNRTFAGAGQAGEPESGAFLLQKLLPFLASDVALMPGNVRRLDLAHFPKHSTRINLWSFRVFLFANDQLTR